MWGSYLFTHMFRRKILLISLFILALTSRLLVITRFPPSLNWDEASLGYNAYSLLLTGRDEWGTAFPVILRAFGDYKLPGYAYFAVLPTRIFGINAAAVRLTSVLAGSFSVILIYLVTQKLFKKTGISLLAGLLLTVSPWSWFLSRIALEANLANMLFLLALCLLLFRRRFLSMLFFGLTVWTYNSYRIFTPLFLLANFRMFTKKQFLLGAVFIIPMFIQLATTSGLARYKWMTLVDSGAVSQIIGLRESSRFSPAVTRFLFNRVTYFGYKFSANYLSHFSPRFMFITGGSNYQFNIPDTGLLYAFLLPFYILGLIILVFTPYRYKKLLLSWLLLAPIAGSLTRDAPHTLRFITILPLPVILITASLVRLPSFIRNRIFRAGIFTAFGACLFFSAVNYFCIRVPEYNRKYSWVWQYGYREVVDYLKNHYQEFDEILVTKKSGEPHEFVLFFWPWSPEKYRTDPKLNRYFRSDWYWVDSFAKFRFIDDWNMEAAVSALDPDKKYLLVTSAPIPATKLTQINFLDNTPAFYLYEK